MINTEGDAVVPVIAVPFTVAEGDDYMTRELKRDNLRNIQLPQVFSTRILKEAHDKFEFTGDATEDSQLIYRLRHAVRFVEGLEYNIKITTPLDLYWAEALFEGGLQTGGVTHA